MNIYFYKLRGFAKCEIEEYIAEVAEEVNYAYMLKNRENPLHVKSVRKGAIGSYTKYKSDIFYVSNKPAKKEAAKVFVKYLQKECTRLNREVYNNHCRISSLNELIGREEE